MTHLKLSRSLMFVASLAALAAMAGCAMNAGEPVAEERTETTAEDLRKAPVANATSKTALSDDSDGTSGKLLPAAPAVAPLLISNDPGFAGGEEEDGPRPHPWSPAPETTETNTNTGSSGSSPSQ